MPSLTTVRLWARWMVGWVRDLCDAAVFVLLTWGGFVLMQQGDRGSGVILWTLLWIAARQERRR